MKEDTQALPPQERAAILMSRNQPAKGRHRVGVGWEEERVFQTEETATVKA